MTPFTGKELRWLADSYEQAQRIRIETGERIRAVLQNRDQTFVPLGSIVYTDDPRGGPDATTYVWEDESGVLWYTPDLVLKAITTGKTLGPVPILGRTYHRHFSEERELFKEMMKALKHHPAWLWLDRVKGIGPTLGCKLLARLDVERAQYVSSFWKHAGLATVPANEYRCSTCGLIRAWPVGYNVTGDHKDCKGTLELHRGPEQGVRCAQPKPSKGEKPSYDKHLKKVMYLVGMSFLKSGGPYDRFYRDARARCDQEHPMWAVGRRHYWALRKTQKLFLSHLWQVWRTAIGLPTPDPWQFAHGEHDLSSKIDPEDMITDVIKTPIHTK